MWETCLAPGWPQLRSGLPFGRRNSRMPPQLEKNHVVPPSALDEALARYSVPPAALKVTSGHRHPEHAPSDDIALGAGPSRAPAMGRHHPEMVTAAKAASCRSQARGLQPASPVPPSPVSFHPTWGLAMGGALPKLELLILSREPSISPCCLCLRLGPHQGS